MLAFPMVRSLSVMCHIAKMCARATEAQDLIRRFLTVADKRLGRDGCDEIRRHPFFADPDWNFDNIRQGARGLKLLPSEVN